MSVFSIATLFAAAGFVLVAAALLLTRVSADGQQRFGEGPSASLRKRLRILHDLPAAQTIIGLMAVQTFVRGCLNVLLVVASFEVLHRGSIAVGFLTGAIGVGALVGAVAASMLNARRLLPIFAVSLAFWSLPIAPLGFMTRLLLAALVVAVIGPGGMGTAHVNQLAGNNAVRVAYICDVDEQRAAKAAETVTMRSGQAPKVVKET